MKLIINSFILATLLLWWVNLVGSTPPNRQLKATELHTSSIKAVEFISSNLPIISINTHGRDIRDEFRIPANMGIIYNGEGLRNNLTDSLNEYNGKISIELRGSSTLQFPKKQYAVETQDSVGNNLNVSLLGIPRENDWVLNAPYSDKSLIRNILAYKISREMNQYASRSRLCELVLNNEYHGVYVLLEKVKRDNDRVDITRMTTADTSADSLTGGYIVKIDKMAGEVNDGWYSLFKPNSGTSQRIFYQYHYPKARVITDEQKQYIKDFIREFEMLMFSIHYDDPDSGYVKKIDVASFVDYFIVNELSKNVDGFRLSAYMHKDRDSKNGKLIMGPVWDFNLAFGNANYYSANSTSGWQLEFFANTLSFQQADGFQMPFWWNKLWNDPVFKNRVYFRWWELRHNVLDVENLLTKVDSLAVLLAEGQARNFEKWPELGRWVWPNAYVGLTFADEIEFLKEWLQDRIQWIDDNLTLEPIAPQLALTGIEEETNFSQPQTVKLEQNYPNPFNSSTKIQYQLPKSGEVSLKIYNMLGQVVNTLVASEQEMGTYSVTWDGRDMLHRLVPSGIYAYRLVTNSKEGIHSIETRKLLFIQ